jgi:acyl-CoA synthetase (AMP-forming)/AMP-acid ligase II
MSSVTFTRVAQLEIPSLPVKIHNFKLTPFLVIKHFRYYFVTLASGHAFGVTSDDRVYVTMPMYHSAAGIIGIGQLALRGCTVVIRKKFSASNFWKDCLKYECTVSSTCSTK